jgi:hypothetical protein
LACGTFGVKTKVIKIRMDTNFFILQRLAVN